MLGMDVITADSDAIEAVYAHTPGDPDDSGFDPALLTTATRQRLTAIARLGAPVAILFSSRVDDLAPGSALLLASRWVRSPEARSTDVRHLFPEGDRWTVGELEELILAPAHHFPVERHVFIIERADAMDARCADRLLKTLEEPPSATTFVLCATDPDNIAATIRGRIEHHIALEAAPAEVRVEALTSGGITRAAAQSAVDLAGPAISLAMVLALYPELSSAAERVLRSPAWSYTSTPVSDAIAIVEDAAVVAASWYQGKPVKRTPEKLSPVERARMRQLLGLCLERHLTESGLLLTKLATEAGGSLNVEGRLVSTAVVESRLRAAEAAIRQLRAYTSPKLVLAALLSAH